MNNINKKYLFHYVAFLIILPKLSLADTLKVTRVIDGDTLKVINESNQETTIGLVGIDAPETSKRKGEPGQPFSQKATKCLASLVLNKTITIKEYGTDLYGRVLAVVFIDSKDMNLEMLKAELAEVYRGPPAKGLDLQPYWKAEEEARAELRGMWSLGDKYVSPRDWRKQHER